MLNSNTYSIKNLHYYNRYIKFIEHAKTLIYAGYTETHHIIPVSMGGSNKKENLVKFCARSHFIAHKLLFLAYRNDKMAYAMHRLTNRGSEKYIPNPKLYEKTRIEVSKIRSESQRGEKNHRFGKKTSDETKKKLSDALRGEKSPHYGKPLSEERKQQISNANKGRKHTEETRRKNSESHRGENHHYFGKTRNNDTKKKISEALKGRYTGQDNPFYGKTHSEETRQKLSDMNKGKTLSKEIKKKISDSLKGENNPFYGKTHSEETRQKMRLAQQNMPILICPFCKYQSKSAGNMKKHHFESCKLKDLLI